MLFLYTKTPWQLGVHPVDRANVTLNRGLSKGGNYNAATLQHQCLFNVYIIFN